MQAKGCTILEENGLERNVYTELVEQGQGEQPHLAEFVHWIAPQKGDFLFRPKPDPKY